MKRLGPILVLVCSTWCQLWGQTQNGAPASAQTASASANAAADENTHKAKTLVEQGIKALGGENYLTIRDREQQGRGYAFHAGRPSGTGAVFWSFAQFPDKERVELTKERDIAELYVGSKGYEITYKGAHAMEQKDLDDYLRRRHFSLDAVLRTWINDPGVIFLYEGFAVAAQHPSDRVTLINSKNEAVTLYFDSDNHLPVKKTFEWRDPIDRQKNIEEEVYDNYRPVQGIMAPFNVTRFFNGDMAGERFFNTVSINQGLNPAMFDPNSGYDPNKQTPKH